MTPINDISHFSQNLRKIDQEKKLKHYETAKTQKADESQKASSAYSGKDKVEISSTGRSIAASRSDVSKYVDTLRQMPTLDKDRLSDIHSKIKSNFYTRPEVLETIVDSMISSGPSQSVSKDGFNSTKEPLKEEQLQHIREKIKSGDYNSNNVINTVVNELMDIL